MPLVTLCGIPSSGKSRRALELAHYVQEKQAKSTESQERTDAETEQGPSSSSSVSSSASSSSTMQVIVINEESLGVIRNHGYQDPIHEKQTRGMLKDEVKRWLSQDTFVILDSMNYIKGFRYELFCIAKENSTPHCVLFCDTDVETARSWNSIRQTIDEDVDSYCDVLFEDLVKRIERPNGANRWEKPLFTVSSEETTPCEEIWRICSGSPSKSEQASFATSKSPLQEGNFRFELDRITNAIVRALMDAQQNGILPGDRVIVPHSSSLVVLPGPVSLGELRKLRVQFSRFVQLKPPSVDQLGVTFVAYLNEQLASYGSVL